MAGKTPRAATAHNGVAAAHQNNAAYLVRAVANLAGVGTLLIIALSSARSHMTPPLRPSPLSSNRVSRAICFV